MRKHQLGLVRRRAGRQAVAGQRGVDRRLLLVGEPQPQPGQQPATEAAAERINRPFDPADRRAREHVAAQGAALLVAIVEAAEHHAAGRARAPATEHGVAGAAGPRLRRRRAASRPWSDRVCAAGASGTTSTGPPAGFSGFSSGVSPSGGPSGWPSTGWTPRARASAARAAASPPGRAGARRRRRRFVRELRVSRFRAASRRPRLRAVCPRAASPRPASPAPRAAPATPTGR